MDSLPPSHSQVGADLVTGPSNLAGTGLFTTIARVAGSTLGEVGGAVVPAAEAGDALPIAIDGTRVLLVDDGPLRRTNHACDASAGWDGWTLVALRDLAPGDEVTWDYATAVIDPDWILRCHCDSARCRQMVEGTDWRIPALRRRYAGRWSPTVQRMIDAESLSGAAD